MNKRYQVFVSSTFKDLAEERMEVVKALLELDCIPCGMEYFPAASEDSWSYISDLIKQCDYYVLIVAGRYGSITNEGISFTQKEYQCAVENNIPVLAFLREDVESLPVKKVDEDPELKKKLDSFVKVLKDNNLCKGWRNADDLGAVVSRGITQLIKRVPRIGWIRADEMGLTDAAYVLELTQQISELEKKVRKYEGESSLANSGIILADGDEKVELSFTYSICYYDKPDEKFSCWQRPHVREEKRGSADLSWNDVFAAVAPKVATGVSAEGVKKSIGEMILLKDPPRINQKGDFCQSIIIDGPCFDRIRVQFEALQLLVVKREPTGKHGSQLVKWHLTDRGRRRMIELLAVRSKKRA